jgi:hypothetical protein
MKVAAAVSVLALFILTAPVMASTAGPAAAAQPAPIGAGAEDAAEAAALGWLRLLDAGSYPQSWTAASTLFRDRMSQSRWRTKIANGRFRLGTLKSRRFLSASPAQTPPDLPKGEYVIVRFACTYLWFEFEPVIETVTMTQGADGTWRVADFYMHDGGLSSYT